MPPFRRRSAAAALLPLAASRIAHVVLHHDAANASSFTLPLARRE